MDLISCLFIFSPMKENKKFTCIHPKHFRVSEIKISKCSDKRNFSNITADTVATANKISQSLRGLIHRCRI